MQNLPTTFRTYYPKGQSGSNVSLSYWFSPKEEELLAQRGSIGLFISLSGPEDLMGERMSKFIWDSFQEAYFYSESAPVTDLLKNAVKAAHKRLIELMKNEPSISEQGVDLHMCAFVVFNNVAYVAVIGNPGVMLFRDGESVDIRDMLPAFEGVGYKEEVTVGQFKLERCDILLVTTPELINSFVGIFGEGELKDVVSNWSRFSDELTLYSDNMSGNQYIWLIGFDVKETKIEEKTDEKGSEAASVAESVAHKDTHGGITHKLKQTAASIKNKLKVPSPKAVVGKVKDKVKSFDLQAFKRKVGSRVSEFKMRGTRPRKLFVRKVEPGKKVSKRMALGIAIIVFVLAALGFSWYSFQQRKALIAVDSRISDVQNSVDSASATWLNMKDRDLVTQAINTSNTNIADLESGKLTQEQRDKIQVIKGQIQDILDTMDRVVPLSESAANVEILMDTYLKIGESADVEDMVLYGDYLYMVDKASHAVYRYIPGSEAVERVANSQDLMKEPTLIDVGDNYMFVYDKKVGVLSMDVSKPEGEWQFKAMPEVSAQSVGEVEEMGVFGDNLYLLKKDTAMVLKSYPAGAGFTYPQNYFSSDTFNEAADLLIDGNIYVLTNTEPKLLKYFSGQEDTFQLSALDKPLGLVTCGFTNLLDTSNLYVFDSENSRIVSIEKGMADKHPGVGVMTQQYVYRGSRDDILKDVKEIVGDVNDEYLYVLDGTRILRVSLSHD